MVGTVRCAVPARVQRAEQNVQAINRQPHSFRRLTLRLATGTAQRTVPTDFGVWVEFDLDKI